MRKYLVPLEVTVEAEDGQAALELVRYHLNHEGAPAIHRLGPPREIPLMPDPEDEEYQRGEREIRLALALHGQPACLSEGILARLTTPSDQFDYGCIAACRAWLAGNQASPAQIAEIAEQALAWARQAKEME